MRPMRLSFLSAAALAFAIALSGCKSSPAPAPAAAATVPQEELTIPVEGMVCGGCEGAIHDALAKVPGVSAATASHKERRVVVRFDPGKVTRAQLEQAITGLGYTVPPPSLPLDAPAE